MGSVSSTIKLIRDVKQKYAKVFGEKFITYNFHHMLHLEKMRDHGPFGDISSIPFEAFFSTVTRSYRRGTPNIPLQAMQFVYTRLLRPHACRRSVSVKDKVTSRSNDSLIYQFFPASKTHRFYEVQEVLPDNQLRCFELQAFAEASVGGNVREWHKVGVYTLAYSMPSNEITIPLEEVTGKAIMVQTNTLGKFIMTISPSILREN